MSGDLYGRLLEARARRRGWPRMALAPQTPALGRVILIAILALLLALLMARFVMASDKPGSGIGQAVARHARFRAEGRGLARLLDAIRQVESGGRADAVGDQGRALGPYQIRRSYYRDAARQIRHEGGKRVDDRNWRGDVRDEATARRLVLAYWRRHAARALATGDVEALARVHNGGPNGHKRPATATYWQKVQRVMAQAKVQ